MAYLRLFDPVNQFQTKNGALNVSGRLFVYLSETDDLAPIFDENGTQLQQPAILDNNGRARGLFVDADKVYWMDVQDAYGNSLFTIRDMTCMGSGGSSAGATDIISSDGSISIDKYVEAGETKYDIGLAPQSDEFLEWCKCSEDNISNGNWYPTVLEGTMESQVGTGLHVNKGQLYHITTTIKVDPTGAGVNYDTLSANLMFNDGEEHNVVRRNYDVDSSVNDPVLCEFSYDFIPDNDGYIYLGIEGVAYFEHVSVEMQVHRIYSGINAVPDTCATKQWVQETFDYNMSSKVDYSAIEHNTYGEVTGISGSAIAGGLDSATVSAIASSYAESAVSSKVDQSAFDNCCSAMSGYVSSLQTDVSSISASVSAVTGQTGNYIDWSASGTFAPSGNYVSASDMSSYVPFSGLETDNGKITSISGTALGGHEYSGIWPVVVDNTADTIAVLNKSLCVNETMTGYESAGSAVIGVNTATVLSGLSAYAYESSLSAKLDASASSDFYPYSGNPSGYLTAHQSLAGYATVAYVDSSVSSKLDSSAYDSAWFQPASAMSAYAYESSLSAKLDASASSEFYSTSNPSGFITGVDLSNYATTGYVDSSVSGKQDISGMTAYQPAGDYQPSGDYIYESALGWAEV